jgi:small subunit ribosomal protein S6
MSPRSTETEVLAQELDSVGNKLRALEARLAEVKKIIETAEGKVNITQQLGRKRLAYPINKFREGSYVYMELSGPGAMVSAIENFFKVNDAVIRYLNVKVEKKKEPKVAAKPAAAPATATAPATAPAAQPAATEEVKSNESANKPQTPGAE